MDTREGGEEKKLLSIIGARSQSPKAEINHLHTGSCGEQSEPLRGRKKRDGEGGRKQSENPKFDS